MKKGFKMVTVVIVAVLAFVVGVFSSAWVKSLFGKKQ